MRLILIGIFILLAILTIVVPLFKKKKPSIFMAVLLLVPAVALGYFEYTWVEKKEKLETSFRNMTEVYTANLECERMSMEWFNAYITVGAGVSTSPTNISLKHITCAPLFEFQALENINELEIDNAFTNAVIVFGEAAVRMKNPGYDSNRVSCTAIMNIPQTVMALGGTEQQGYLTGVHYFENMKDAKLKGNVTC